MKKLLSFLAMALLFVACQNEPGFDTTENGLVTARFGVIAHELSTRADEATTTTGFSSALGAIDNFTDAEWAKYNLRFTFEVYAKDDNGSGTPIAKERQVKVVDKFNNDDVINFEVRLVPNKEYKFVVFADFVDNGTTAEDVEDLYYNTTDLCNITMIDGKMNPMDEARDAYFISENHVIKTSLDKTLKLTRPFGKIRVVTTDFEHIKKYAAPAKAKITYYNHEIFKSFNAVNGQVSTARAGEAELSFEYDLAKDKLYTEGRDKKASDMTLFADYLLARREGQSEVNFLLSVYDAKGDEIKSNDFNLQIPIERNHLTTIEGNLLTTQTNVKVVIDDNFDENEIIIDNIWDGVYEELPKADANGVVTITSAGELATLFTEGSDNSIVVEITEDYNFDGYVIDPVNDMKKFKNIVINGNNNTISNFVINGAETRAEGGVAALFPTVVGAKIENLTISNITVDAGEGENAYAGALIGRSFGTVELNNVVVVNSTIKGTNKVGGLIGSVMEDKVIMTNCGVEGVTIETYDVEDESGLAGGLIGYIACAENKLNESRIEYCFVKNSKFTVINSRGNEARSNSEFIGGIGGDKGDTLLINNATIEGNEFNETGAEEYTSPYGKFIGGIRGNFKVYIDGMMVGKLEKPVVVASVEGNVITLTWEAVDGAEAYSITNGTETPVVVETTEYTFTGEYDTTYTFAVAALPNNEGINTASDAAEVTVTTKEEPARKVTVAEFLAAAEDSTMYELTGVITSVTNTTYGNFYLKDETGEVLIYGLCSPAGAQKYWAESGAKVGDTITVQTVRTSHNGAPQGKNALFVELTPFVAEKSEWGVVGDLTSWGNNDIAMYTTWHTKNLFVAYNIEITSGAFKIRANNQWNDAKNYGLEIAGSIYNNKYYSVITSGGSQNITPMEYGKYDIYFDLTNKRVALMTPGKAYSEAENGGNPIVVIAGLKDHEWGVIGSFAASSGWTKDVEMVVDDDWAVAKNVALAKNDEFKFRADKAWTLSYGTGGNVNIGQTYTTYNNGGNMKYVGEAGSFDIYFSLVDASFYMEQHVDKTEYTSTLTFDNKSKRTVFNSNQQVWEENGVTLINDKASSNNAVADYVKPARFYQGSKITVKADGGEISKIVFDCNSSSYATELKNSIGSSATASSDKVTVTLDGATEYVVAKLVKQVRMDGITVTYMK